MAAKTRNYQGLAFFSPTLSEEAIAGEISGLTDSFPEGTVEVKNLGLKKFAYPIRKETRGFHVQCWFSADARGREQLELRLKGNPAVLRYLITYALREPKPKARQKEEA